MTSGIHQGSILGPILFNFFINDLDDGAECTPSKSADDIKLGGVADVPESPATIRGPLDSSRLEKWADKNLLQIKKGKCKVLHLERNNLMYQYMLGNSWLESSFAEKDLGVLEDTKLNMSQRCALAAKRGNGTLGCVRSAASRLREVILPLYSALVRLHLECWVQLWGPQYKRDMDTLHMTKGQEHLSYEERAERAGTVQPGEQKAQGDHINV
ncbi:mitochondrial enolase superfamily member 1 [Grus japonensis]|uniref:Mitochondrial enolase superfamily member 1 n=1 Tax=Grus japonensis TaxID=30415 RepID=A0ABC9VY53_GRUJA